MKVSDKLTKVQETISINLYDNGFLFELAGVDANKEWGWIVTNRGSQKRKHLRGREIHSD